MRYLPDADQMQQADSYTIQTLKIPSLELMERAAASCVEVMEEMHLDLSKVLIVCGAGNNGGDGFAIGRMLRRKGYDVQVIFAGNMAKRSAETIAQMELFAKDGGTFDNCLKEGEYTIIIDALFGVGLNRDITGSYGELIERLNQANGVKFAVDTPSGVCATTGKIYAHAFRADYTVTFQNAKLGLMLYPGHSYAGQIIIKDIGIKDDPFKDCADVAFTIDKEELEVYMPKRSPDSHKGTCGKALVIAGCKGMAGAAYLNAYAAYMTGAGLVQIYTAEENRQVLQTLLPEAIITTYDIFDEKEVLRLLSRADTVCIGSGIGTSDRSRKILRTVLENVTVPCVIDADGLNLIAENKKYLKYLQSGNFILTPHMKEMSRLSGYSVEELQQDKVRLLREFAKKHPVSCVLKDARTFVKKKDAPMYVNLSGNAAMAKGGSGDVLTGVITGLLAQGMDAFEASCLGVFLHGLAGDSARNERGVYSVLARDLAEHIGEVLKELEG